MKKFFKAFVTVIATICIVFALFVSGCAVRDGADGRDGKDGKDVTLDELYAAARSIPGNENMTIDEFLHEYLSYDDAQIKQLADMQSIINGSLRSAVVVVSEFKTTNRGISYSASAGSGVIIEADAATGDAYVVTNCHVVYKQGADNNGFSSNVYLFLYAQQTIGYLGASAQRGVQVNEKYAIEAEVVGASPAYDIALLKVTGSSVLKENASFVKPAEFSEEDDISLGEYVYAVGDAVGAGTAVTSGVISMDSETINVTIDKTRSVRVMRTDAAINSGNSGGGLFNRDGKIVGIVNARRNTDSDGSAVDNLCYALPVSNVRRLVSLMKDMYTANLGVPGATKIARLGVTLTSTDIYAEYNDGRVEIIEQVGVSAVPEDSVIKGLDVDDVVKHIEISDGEGNVKESKDVTRRYHVTDTLISVRAGDTVKLAIERGKEDKEVSVTFSQSDLTDVDEQ